MLKKIISGGQTGADLAGLEAASYLGIHTGGKMPLGFSEKDIDDHWLPVADFVEKPVDFDVLQSKVAALLKRADSGTPSEQTQ